MKTYRLTLNVLSAFGTPLVGDTLFGQLCWGIRHRFGNEKLKELLNGYTEQKPFLVVSDAFPSNYLPLPKLPSKFWQTQKKIDAAERKKMKKKVWISLEHLKMETDMWQQYAISDKEAFALGKISSLQIHNTINRKTNTTSTGQFAPYSQSQTWYAQESQLDLYVVLDEDRFSLENLKLILADIGTFGYGRDASTGMGKFIVKHCEEFSSVQNNPNSYFTLANCAPFNCGLNAEQSFYQITTRFGRHGNILGLGKSPFKKPILLTKAAAIFSPKIWQEKMFIGNGLTGISYSSLEAIHQGYAPILAIHVDFSRCNKEC